MAQLMITTPELTGQYERPILNKRHHLQALGNNYKDLYEFIPQATRWSVLFRAEF